MLLSALIVLAPLPGLPQIPNGAEIRIVSTDLRTVYLFWTVVDGELRLKSSPLPIPEGSRVRLIVRSGKQVYAYEGRYLENDVLIEVRDGYISVKQSFVKVYHLRWSPSDKFFEGLPNPKGRSHGGNGGKPS